MTKNESGGPSELTPKVVDALSRAQAENETNVDWKKHTFRTQLHAGLITEDEFRSKMDSIEDTQGTFFNQGGSHEGEIDDSPDQLTSYTELAGSDSQGLDDEGNETPVSTLIHTTGSDKDDNLIVKNSAIVEHHSPDPKSSVKTTYRVDDKTKSDAAGMFDDDHTKHEQTTKITRKNDAGDEYTFNSTSPELADKITSLAAKRVIDSAHNRGADRFLASVQETIDHAGEKDYFKDPSFFEELDKDDGSEKSA